MPPQQNMTDDRVDEASANALTMEPNSFSSYPFYGVHSYEVDPYRRMEDS